MAYDYVKARAKLFHNLADHCHDKALETSFPSSARDWIVLMDACLWLAHPDAEIEVVERLFKDSKGHIEAQGGSDA